MPLRRAEGGASRKASRLKAGFKGLKVLKGGFKSLKRLKGGQELKGSLLKVFGAFAKGGFEGFEGRLKGGFLKGLKRGFEGLKGLKGFELQNKGRSTWFRILQEDEMFLFLVGYANGHRGSGGLKSNSNS